jgi:hypothetical protein
MKFAMLGYHVENSWTAMSKSDQHAMIEACFGYDKRLMKEGHMIDGGAALQASQTAKTLRWQNGKVTVTDGPFAETKEQLGGIAMLEAEDTTHAVELIVKHPGLHYGSTFEIRPIDADSLERKDRSLAASGASAPPVDPQRSRFASLGYIDGQGWGSRSEADRDEMMRACIAFDEARIKSGEWLSGVGLQGAHTAKTLRAKASRVVVTDGPFAETKEYLGGIVVLALKDLNDGISTLSRHPALRFGVAIEVRPMNEEIHRLWEERVNSAE